MTRRGHEFERLPSYQRDVAGLNRQERGTVERLEQEIARDPFRHPEYTAEDGRAWYMAIGEGIGIVFRVLSAPVWLPLRIALRRAVRVEVEYDDAGELRARDPRNW